MAELVPVSTPYGRPQMSSYRLRQHVRQPLVSQLGRFALRHVPTFSWFNGGGGVSLPRRVRLTHPLPLVDRICVRDGLSVTLLPSGTPSIEVDADEDLLELLRLDHEDSSLAFHLGGHRIHHRVVRLTVRLPQLVGLDAFFASHVLVCQVPTSPRLELRAYGQSSVRFFAAKAARPERLELENSGSQLSVEGSFRKICLESVRAGHTDLKGACEQADLGLAQESELQADQATLVQVALRMSASSASLCSTVMVRGAATRHSRLVVRGEAAVSVDARDGSTVKSGFPSEASGTQAFDSLSSAAGVA